jgi:tetratricopeptide (TPR) repeat protein
MTTGIGTNYQDVTSRLLAQISAAVAASDMQRAFDLANVLASQGVQHPIVFNARGLWMQQTGRYEEALEEFHRALAMAPGNATILNAIGLCQFYLSKFKDAIEAYDAALVISPDFPHTHYRRGLALAASGNHGAAQAAHERAIELEPNFAEPIGILASLAARRGEVEKARAFADRALSLKPQDTTALVALALLELGEKKFVEAEQRLRKLLDMETLSTQPRAAILGLLGDALDGQKRYTEAFAVYLQENGELRRENAHRFSGGQATQSANYLIKYFEETTSDRWRASDGGGSNPEAPAEHVFLLGFMRSGTTLLEQVLASNPKVVALEEKGLLNGLGERYLTSVPALDALAAMNGTELEQNRRLYWDRIRSNGLDVAGKIFVDKQPLNTVKLPLIAKLFPKAKVLFALRDPRDVVFSCFRRHFQVNLTMFEFLDLEDSARFYAAIMRLADIYREKLPLNLFEHRYEDMVQDFEGRMRAVCEFIGVEWDDSMRNFNKYAPAVDLRSPSATQVRKPLYSEAIAQWRRYGNQLAPILPILRPWVERFGYPAE